jgi:hypothetical protein
MANIIEGMHSYFWLASSRLREPIRDEVPYTTQALRQDLLRVRLAWEECQASRDRNAIYGYLGAVFDLVMWWAAEHRAISRARWALQLQRLELPATDEPFAAVIRCSSDPGKVDKRTRSKWSRVLRYSAEYKSHGDRFPRSFAAKVGSTSVRRDLAFTLGEVVALTVDPPIRGPVASETGQKNAFRVSRNIGGKDVVAIFFRNRRCSRFAQLDGRRCGARVPGRAAPSRYMVRATQTTPAHSAAVSPGGVGGHPVRAWRPQPGRGPG